MKLVPPTESRCCCHPGNDDLLTFPVNLIAPGGLDLTHRQLHSAGVHRQHVTLDMLHLGP
jgi:hypothetical protein